MDYTTFETYEDRSRAASFTEDVLARNHADCVYSARARLAACGRAFARRCVVCFGATQLLLRGLWSSPSGGYTAVPLVEDDGAIDLLDTLAATEYDPARDDHEDLLESLWGYLQPGEVRSGRVSHDWKVIGFQGNDPATDFRGAGELGLQNLVYFAQFYTAYAVSMVRAQDTTFPFAIAGINVTMKLLNLLHQEPEVLRALLLRTQDCENDALKSFNECFSCVFVAFHRYYVARRPANLLEFNRLCGEFFASLTPHRVHQIPSLRAHPGLLAYSREGRTL